MIRFWFGGEAEIALVNGGDLLETREDASRPARPTTRPGLDAQREVPAAIVAAQPAEAVALRGELVRARRFEREAQPLEQLGLEPVDAAIGDGVLEARVFAIGAIAEVALDHDHGLGHLEHLVRASGSR